MMTDQPSPTDMSVRELRRRWKPTKEKLADSDRHEPIRIRIHRTCSWLQRVEEIEPESASDTGLIFRWIALNSLYGIWDDDAGQPTPDREALESFLDMVAEIDREELLPAILEEHRDLVMSVFDDEYLTTMFWKNPTERQAKLARKTRFSANTWYLEKRYRLILDQVVGRIYFLRCQLIHGGATLGSKLNRDAVSRCATMLGHLLPAVVVIMIDHGVDEDWGPLCYPPMRASDGHAGR